MEALGTLLSLPVLWTLSAIWRGFVLSKLWGWFIVTTFDLPELAIAPAIGLAIVVSYLTYTDTSDIEKKSDDDSVGEKLLKAAIKTALQPAFALLIGWIVVQFM